MVLDAILAIVANGGRAIVDINIEAGRNNLLLVDGLSQPLLQRLPGLEYVPP